jgi:Bacterial Ig-like domain (group 3)/FG-GAP-like repeat
MRLLMGFGAGVFKAGVVVACGIFSVSIVGMQPASAQVSAAAPSVQPSTPSIQRYRRPMFGAHVLRKTKQVSKYGGGKALPEDPAEGIKAAIALPPANVPLAPFLGQYTAILASPDNGFVMARETNCSLTAFNVPYTLTPSDPYSAPDSKTTNYNQQLHLDSGLSTTSGVFAGGCADPQIGIPANDLIYAGMSTGGMRMSAAAVYDAQADNGQGNNVLYTFVMKEDGTYIGTTTQPLPNGMAPYGAVAADLNKDGNPDIIAVGFAEAGNAGATVTATMISVLLGNADGTFTVGQTYTLSSATFTDSAVIDDFNGDGKLDVVVAEGGLGGNSAADKLTFLPGNGDGTFGTAVTLALSGTTAEGIVSADFNGDGKKDILSGTGWLYRGNGDGTFQQPTVQAFPRLDTNSSATAGLAVGDFNKDGKSDFAAGNGDAIYIYFGNGDGTFTAANSYASIDNHGGLMATDLDGDGNLDLYSGNAQAGIFSGDDFTASAGYALMGRSDGTFVGAPIENASFLSMQDLNGDGKLDFIGVTGDTLIGFNPVFSTYYGNGDGTFRQAAGSLNATIFTYQGTQAQVGGLDSYATGDINGDGRPDLVYVPSSYASGGPGTSGIVTAISNADGSFQAPVFTPVPYLTPGGTPDYPGQPSGLIGLTNQAGKFELLYGFSDQILNSDNSVTYNTGFATQVANGDGTFAAPAITYVSSTNSQPASQVAPNAPVAVGDLNGDKIPDLVIWTPAVYNYSGSNGPVLVTPAAFQVMLGKADGTFAAGVAVPINNVVVTSGSTPVTIGDVNGDGIPDLVGLGQTADANAYYYLGVVLGKGDGTFVAQPPYFSPLGFDFGSIAIGDFTGDGKADIAFTTFQNASGNAVYPGNGDGSFQGLTTTSGATPATQPLNIVLGTGFGPSAPYDVNGDGKMDLVAAGTFLLQAAAPANTTPTVSSTTTLTASPTSVTAGQSVTFTATVAAPTGNNTVPTGTVTFLDGTTSLGAGALNSSGVAAFATTTLASGTHSITASYGGDAIFVASTSSAVSVTVAAPPPPDFTASLSPSSATVKSGGSTTTTISITPSGGFNSAVSFTCSGLPSGAACAFSPTTVTPSGTAAVTTTLTITTATAAAKLVPATGTGKTVIAWAALLLGMGALVRSRRQWRRGIQALQMLAIAAILAGLAGLAGCGGSGSGHKSTTSTITVTATGGSETHTTTFSLTVQ